MKARVILHEDGLTKMVQTTDGVLSFATQYDGTLTLFLNDKVRVYTAKEWNKLEIDK